MVDHDWSDAIKGTQNRGEKKRNPHRVIASSPKAMAIVRIDVTL